MNNIVVHPSSEEKICALWLRRNDLPTKDEIKRLREIFKLTFKEAQALLAGFAFAELYPCTQDFMNIESQDRGLTAMTVIMLRRGNTPEFVADLIDVPVRQVEAIQWAVKLSDKYPDERGEQPMSC